MLNSHLRSIRVLGGFDLVSRDKSKSLSKGGMQNVAQLFKYQIFNK